MDVLTRGLSVVNRTTGSVQELPFNDLQLKGHSIVKIPASQASVVSSQRLGDHLVLKFTDGSTLKISDFFAATDNQVVFDDGNSLWLGQHDAALNALQFTELTSLDALLLVPAAPVAGVSWAAIGLGAGGVGVAAAAGGGGGSDAESSALVRTPLSLLEVDPTGVMFTGRGEPGASIVIRNSAGQIVGTGTVSANGAISIIFSPAQIDGTVLTVSQADSNSVVFSTGTVVTPDLLAPDAPILLAVNSDGSVVTGRGEPGAVVTIRNASGEVIGTGIVASDGSFSIPLSPAQIDASMLSVVLTDASGNSSVASMVQSPDLIAPDAPTALQISNDGSVITGLGEPGTQVTVRSSNGEVIGTGIVAADGSFSIPLSPAQMDASMLSVVLTDASGNSSVASMVQSPDLIAPDAPTALQISNDGSVITGLGEPGTQVTVRSSNGEVIGTGIVAADGSFSILLSPAQMDASMLSVVLTDASGNSSVASMVQSPDLIAPDAPTALQISNDGSVITGLGEPGTQVTVRSSNGEVIGTGIVAADGSFSILLSPAQIDASMLSVVLSDSSENSSLASTILSPDLLAPAPPTSLSINSDGTVLAGQGTPGSTVTVRNAANQIVGSGVVQADGTFVLVLSPPQIDGAVINISLTNASGHTSLANQLQVPDLTTLNMPTNIVVHPHGQLLQGDGHPGAEVMVHNADNHLIGWGFVNPDGSFSIVLSPPQTDGRPIRLTLRSEGQYSDPVMADAPDMVAPILPQMLQITADGGMLTGKGEAGASVIVRNANDNIIATGVVGADGSFSLTLTPIQNNGGILTVSLMDTAGNQSASGSVRAPDRVSPDSPVDLQVTSNGQTVTGMGEAGTVVTVRNASNQMIGLGVVLPDGTFSISLSPVQQDGSILNVTLTDGGGNSSAVSFVSSPDLIAPNLAQQLQLNADGTVLTGMGEAGATVKVRNAANLVVGTGTVLADGSFSITLNPPQIDGGVLSVVLTDAGGNDSLPATLQTQDLTEIDPPFNLAVSPDGLTLTGQGEAGTFISVWDANGVQVGSGMVLGDGSFSLSLNPAQLDGGLLQVILSDGVDKYSALGLVTTPDQVAPDAADDLLISADGSLISGTAEAGATVTVRNAANQIIGSGTVLADGSFSINLTPAQIDGSALSVQVTDPSGNHSALETITSPDLTAPTAPSQLSINANGSILSGAGEVGALVTVRNAANQVVGTATVQADGRFSLALIPAQADGLVLTVTLTDAAGNASATGSILTPDLAAPALADNLLIAPDGTALSGTGEAGATVMVRNAANQIVGSGTVLADGSFSLTLNPPQVDGSAVSVVLTDFNGNSSAASPVTSPDLTAPALPDQLSINANGNLITGTGEVGALVTVRNAANQVIGTATVQADGRFSVALVPAQIEGSLLSISLTDTAGNTSVAGTVLSPDFAPDAAQNMQLNADGTVLTGSGEAGAAVTVRNAANLVVGTGTVLADGSFSLVLNPPQIDGGVLSVVLTDAGGNHSIPATLQTQDLTEIDPPFNLAVSPDGLTLTGQGEAGTLISVWDANGVQVGSGMVLGDGSFSLSLNPAQLDGGLLQVILSDGVDKYSAPGLVTTPDQVAPDAAEDLLITNDGSVITGTAEAGATVTVRNAANQIIGSGIVLADGSFSINLTPAQLDGSLLSIQVTDNSGNHSALEIITSPDLTAPSIPSQLSINANGSVLSGTGEVGAQVIVRNAANQVVGTATVQADGRFSLALTPAQADGSALTVTLIDAAGNTSATGSILTPDLAAPALAANLLITPDGTALSGTGEVGATVTVRNAANQIVGSGTVLADGSFSLTLNPPQLDGSALEVVLTDLNGNSSAASSVASPDLTSPALPAQLSINANGNLISGTGEVGALVTVRNAANQIIGTATVQADGSFSVALTPAQIEGTLLSVSLTDTAGNTSVAGTVLSPDFAPDAAQNLQLNADGTILSGTGEVGAVVTVRNAANLVVGTGTVLADGSFSLVLNPPQIDGGVLSVVLTDAGGNHSVPATLQTQDLTEIDPPFNLAVSPDGLTLTGQGEAGTFISVWDANGVQVGSGMVLGDGSFSLSLNPAQLDGGLLQVILSDGADKYSAPGLVTTPDELAPDAAEDVLVSADGSLITGTAEAGATVTVRNAANQIVGTGTVLADGSFSLSLTPVQMDGSALSVQVTDASGNHSALETITSPDLTAPVAPSQLSINANGSVLSGTGEVGAQVIVRNAANQVVGTATVQANGSFSLTLTPAQADGSVLTVTLIDAAGNTSATDSIITPDLSAPALADHLLIAADGTALSGTGEAGATVTVRNAANQIVGTGTVLADGSFSLTLNPPQLDGSALEVVLTDLNGNSSAASSVISPDLTAPALPAQLSINANGNLITGTGEVGALVTVRNAANQIIGTATVQADGSFSVVLTPAQIEGALLSVSLTDTAGNTSVAGTVLSPDFAPDAAQNMQLNADGTILSGTGEVGAVVTVRNAANLVVGTGTVLADGSFSLVLNPPQIDGGVLSVVLTDAGGNHSVPATLQTQDLTEIDPPFNLAVSPDGLTLTGQGEAGTLISVWDANGVQVGSGMVLGDGSFSLSLNPAQLDGGLLQVILSDGVDKYSAPGLVTTPDLVAPDAAEDLSVSVDGSQLTGTAEAGATVTVRNAANQIIGSGTVLADGSFSVALTPAQIDGSALSVQVTDASGNHSALETITSPDLTAPLVADQLGVSADGLTLSGTGEVGAVVTVRDTANQIIGSGTVQNDGTFAITLSTAQLDGSQLKVTLTDASNNQSAVATVQSPDLTAPDLPVNLLIAADGTALSGNGEPGSTVTVRDARNLIVGSGTVLADGSFTVLLNPAQLDGGLLSIVLTDTANNSSATGWLSSPDLLAPDMPFNLSINAAGSSITGQGEIGSLVQVFDAQGQEIGSAIVGADGQFTASLSPAQGDSGLLQLSSTDAAGNTSAVASINAPDLIPPAQALDLQVAADGSSLSGEGEAGTVVTVRNAANQILGTATVLADGSFTVSLNPIQTTGEALQITLTDASGNVSLPATVLSPDLIAPDSPLNLDVSSDGTSLTGTGEAGSQVIVRNAANQIIGSATVLADGSFVVLLTPAQGDSGLLSVTLTDSAGNSSVAATVAAPDLIAPSPASALQLSLDGLSLTGEGEPGALVQVFNLANQLIGTTTVLGDGSFSLSLNPAPQDGSALRVTLTDAAGNTSANASINSLDLLAPEAPLALQLNATGSLLTGTGEVGATVEVRNLANQLLGTAVVQSDGTFSVNLSPVQNTGAVLSVTLTDAAGNDSGSTTITAPDLVAPQAPQNLQISNDGLVLSGTGEIGSTVAVHNASNQLIGTAVVLADGSFSVSLSSAQGDSGLLSITLTDAAGNTSVAGTVVAPDLIAPDAALGLLVNGSGNSLTGTAEAGATIEVRTVTNLLVGTATVQADGSFTVSLNPAQIDGALLSVSVVDSSGNSSTTATVASPDLTAPDAALNLSVNAAGTLLSGTGEAGSTVEVRNALNQLVGTGTVQSDGSFSLVLTPAQGDSGILSVILTDNSNNSSVAAFVNAPDLIAPDAPQSLQITADGSSVTGTGEPFATVVVRNAANQILGSGTVLANGSFMISLSPVAADGGQLTISQTDAAGNHSANGLLMAPDLIEIAAAVNLHLDASGAVLTGNGQAGTQVSVWNEAGLQVGTGVVLPDGSFSLVLVPPQIDGGELRVILTDGAGKYSEPATVQTSDLTAPDSPVNLQLNADGSILTGKGEAGASIEVRNSANQLIGFGVVAVDGSFSISISPAQQDGTELQVRLKDAANNTSLAALITTPDLVAPAAPLNLAVTPDGLTLNGIGEVGATVTVRNAANQVVGTAVVLADGSFSVSLTPAQIDGSALRVTLTDTAGNHSATGSVLSPDLIAPAAAQAVQISANGLTVTGSGEVGASVTVRNAANQIVGTATVQANGLFVVTLLSVQGDSGVLSVVLTDTAGNSSMVSQITAPDLQAPAAPHQLMVNAPGTELTGEGEVGAVVTVYNSALQIVGTGQVASDGTFTIQLTPVQDQGGTLSVVLRDANGNSSVAGVVAAPVVVDIAAFDNDASAKVNILPTLSQSPTSHAAYTLLLGLLGTVNLQVLATPSISFTVAGGNTGQMTLTLDTLLAIGALGDHRIVLQVKNGNQWQAVSGAGQGSFLSVSLLADNSKGVIVTGLAAGEYRAFVAVNALVGLSVATTLSGTLLQADYSNASGYDIDPISGNVLTDHNDDLQQDLITATTVVTQVNATHIAVNGTTLVQGLYGQLTIDAAGNYTYTPNSSAAVIGKAEQFDYQIMDSATGRQSNATLYVRIDSDQVSLSWGAQGQDAQVQLSALDNSAVATIVYKNVVDAPVNSMLGSFSTPGAILVNPGKGTGQYNFQVDANDTSNIIIYAGTSLSLAVLPTFSVVLEKSNGSGGWVAVPGGSVSGVALLGLPLVGTGLSLSVNGLTGGTYRVTVNTTNTVGGSFLSGVQLVQTLTHLDEHVAQSNPGVSGNILTNDVLGSSFTKLFVKGSSGIYQEVNYAGITVNGTYGVLQINKQGAYSYTPYGNQHHSSDVMETFDYQLRHPGGEVVTAQLDIQLDVSGTGVLNSFAMMLPDDSESMAAQQSAEMLSEAKPEYVAYDFYSGWSPDFDVLKNDYSDSSYPKTPDISLQDLMAIEQQPLFGESESGSLTAVAPQHWTLTFDANHLANELEQYQQNTISMM